MQPYWGGGAGAASADVGGDSLAAAYVIPDEAITNTGITIAAYLDAPVVDVLDRDYFKFTLYTQTTISVSSTSANANIDPWGYILTSTGGIVAQNDDAVPSGQNPVDFSIKDITLAAGQYYVYVRPYDLYTTGAYNLTITPKAKEYTWLQGQPAINMGSATSQFCYLTGVAGRFEGTGERVQVYTSGENYYMGGSSLQGGVQGWARCVPGSQSYLNTRIDYSWTQYMNPVQMSAYNLTTVYSNCWLEGMTGKFKGGERISIYPTLFKDSNGNQLTNGAYYLGGWSGQGGVGSWAQCADTKFSTTKSSYTLDQVQNTEQSLTLKPTATHTCYLTSIRGKFMGSGERVRVTKDSKGLSWVLKVASNQALVQGIAMCTDVM